MTGGGTVSVTLADELPEAFVAVSVYVDVTLGVTVRLVPVTNPIP